MHTHTHLSIILKILVLLSCTTYAVAADNLISSRRFAANIILPQTRAFSVDSGRAVEITAVNVGVVILEQVATTTMDISLSNPFARRLEAELILPVPDGAVVRGFTFEGTASEPTAQILPKDEARKTYDSIVAKVRDPALLEFIGYNLVRSSVFPVDANGTQKVRLKYEHLLHSEGNRVDYFLPRSESLNYRVPWQISVRIKSKTPISTVYSPSHELSTVKKSERIVSVRTTDDAQTEPGPFLLSYLLQQNGMSASLLAYPDGEEAGGYFLLFAGPPAKPPQEQNGPAIKREVTLVFDRSGSMNGDKLDQVRQAALQIIAGLEEGEAFNIITYNEAVEFFAKSPVFKNKETVHAARQYMEHINARGGTNIHDALVEALRQKPVEGTLPIVLFLTDGLPTIGITSEIGIRNVAIKANPHRRRVFTFGVGLDVNTPLLSSIATETRATATFVLPKEDVEIKVSQVFKCLSGPVLADPELDFLGENGKPVPGLVSDIIPNKLPDLFQGDQLVLLGRYVKDDPITFTLTGNYLGNQRTFRFTFDFDNATTKNAFVPRLWASRKIALLVDAIRQSGADISRIHFQAPTRNRPDPRMRELVEEIVRLSTRFGILTEYTAFLAREGTDLSSRDQVLIEASSNFMHRAISTRSGLGSLNQEMNHAFQMRQSGSNYRNDYWDANMNRVSITNVQQINDAAFYRRGSRWVDSRLLDQEQSVEPEQVVRFGSDAFRSLAHQLSVHGRQGTISLRGDILTVIDGKTVLIANP